MNRRCSQIHESPHQKSIKRYWKARQFCKADLLATARGSCQDNILLILMNFSNNYQGNDKVISLRLPKVVVKNGQVHLHFEAKAEKCQAQRLVCCFLVS